MASTESEIRYECTAAGVIARGRRKLTVLLVGLSIVMLAVAIATWFSGRIFPGFLALAVATMTFVAWRMGCELNLEWLQIDDDRLTIRAVHQQILVPRQELSVRRLDGEEIAHLEQLASAGGIVAGSGGFDSHVLGEFDLYATDLRNAVLVESFGSRYVVTPDRPDDFIEHLKRAGDHADEAP